MVLPFALSAIVVALLVAASLGIAWSAYTLRAVRDDFRRLFASVRDAHRNGYSDPSAPAVVTSGAREVRPASEPVPAPARVALPAEPAPVTLPAYSGATRAAVPT